MIRRALLIVVTIVTVVAMAAAPAPPARTASLPGGYHTADQIGAALTQLAATAPSIASVQSIGPSWETTRGLANRPIWALRLCARCSGPGATGQPAVVYVGGQHAREISTSEVLLDFARDLVTRWPSDPDVSALLARTTIWIVPLANPDGHVRVEQGQANWRKNTDPTANAPGDAQLIPPDGIGVDLNRNFGYQWGTGGASATPGDAEYQGPSPFSEPETRAMRDFLVAVHPRVLLDYHSPLALVLWPWGYQSAPASDAATLSAAGTRLARLDGYGAGQTFSVVGQTSGDTLDWSHGTLGTLGTLALGVELDGGFAPDAVTLDAIWQRNRTGLLEALRWAADPDRARGPAIDQASISQSNGLVTVRASLSTAHATGEPVVAARYATGGADPAAAGQPMTISGPSATGAWTARVTFAAHVGDWRVALAGQDAAGQWGPITTVGYRYAPYSVSLPIIGD